MQTGRPWPSWQAPSLESATQPPSLAGPNGINVAPPRLAHLAVGAEESIVEPLHQITGTMRALTNSTAVFFAYVVNKLASFAAFYIVSVALPLGQFGLYTLVLALSDIVSSIASFGFDGVLVRMLARESQPAAHKQLLRDAVILKVLCSLLAGSLAIDALLWLRASPELIWGAAIVMADLLFVNIASSFVGYYRSQLRSSMVTVIQAVARGLYLAVLVGLMWSGGSWLAALVVLTGSDAIICLFLGIQLAQRLKAVKALTDSRRWEMLVEAIPLGMAGIAILVYTRLDTLLVAQLRGTQEVAYYSVAYKLTEAPLIIVASIAATALPLISTWSAVNYRAERVAGAARRGLRYGYAITLVIAVAVTFFGSDLVDALYGGRFAVVAPAVTVLIWAMVAMASNQMSTSVLTAIGRQRALMPVALVILTLNVGLNLWAIPQWGYFGSAAATLASEGLNMVVQTAIVCWLLRRLWPAFAAGFASLVGAASLTTFFVPGVPELSLQAKLGAIGVLVLMLVVLRFVQFDDLRRLGRVSRRGMERWTLPPAPSARHAGPIHE